VPAESEEENNENLNNNADDVKRALAAIMSLQGNGADDDVITRKRGSSSELDCTDAACEFAIWGKRTAIDMDENNNKDMEDV